MGVVGGIYKSCRRYVGVVGCVEHLCRPIGRYKTDGRINWKV